MANDDTPHGFVPFGPLLRTRPYHHDASDAAIFIGDVVDMESDGYISAAGATSVVKVGASLTYHVTSVLTTNISPILVADHPSQLFEAQDDGASTPSQTIVGSICDHIAGSGSTTTLMSGHEIGLGSISQTDGGFKILEAVRRPDNDLTAVNADWVVALNVGEGLLTVAAGI